MPIIDVQPATNRSGMKLLISLFGLSESGKTYSAVQLMAGIEPDPAKRGLLDSEGGQRGRAYTDVVPGGYLYGAMTPPFTPERYVEALMDFVEAGVTTLVVDSVSHAWFAEGGVLDMVENATEKNDMAKWAKPKRRLSKMTNKWLQSGLHLILCSRAKQPLVEEIVNGRKTYVPGPITPVQEKSLRYDMTIMAQMQGFGRFSIAPEDGGKCPGTIRDVFTAHGVMDQAMGRKLIEWVGGHDMLLPKQRALLLKAEEVAAGGMTALGEWTKKLTLPQAEFLTSRQGNLDSIAKAADADRARIAAEEAAAAQESRTNMADPFAGPQGSVPEPEDEHEAASRTLVGLTDDLRDIATERAMTAFLANEATKVRLGRIAPHDDLAGAWLSHLSDRQSAVRVGAAA